MGEKKEAIVDVLEELIIKVSLPEHSAKEFLKLARIILDVTIDEHYEFIADVFYLVVKISSEKRSQFYDLLSMFCRANDLTIKKP